MTSFVLSKRENHACQNTKEATATGTSSPGSHRLQHAVWAHVKGNEIQKRKSCCWSLIGVVAFHLEQLACRSQKKNHTTSQPRRRSSPSSSNVQDCAGKRKSKKNTVVSAAALWFFFDGQGRTTGCLPAKSKNHQQCTKTRYYCNRLPPTGRIGAGGRKSITGPRSGRSAGGLWVSTSWVLAGL
jgi:hypothetical protein